MAFPAVWRSGLASPEHPAVAPWDGPGATPVSCARWPIPVSPWGSGGGGRQRDLALVQAPAGLSGSPLLREGHWEREREKGSPWVTQHILSSSSSRSLPKVSFCHLFLQILCVFIFTCSLSQSTNIERSSVSCCRGGDLEKDGPQLLYTAPYP